MLIPNRGARLRAVDIDFVRNIFELRIAIETMLARRAAGLIEISAFAALGADVVASVAMAHAAKAKQELIARMSSRDIAVSSAAA